MRYVVCAAICACVLAMAAVPAEADVTIKLVAKGPLGDSPSVQYIKGMKMRMESSLGGREMASIIDVANRQMIVLDAQTREAIVYDLKKIGDEMQKVAKPQDTNVLLTPTGQTRQLLDRTCTGYTLSMTTTVMMGPNAVRVSIGGPVWLAKDAPGTKDWVAFFKAAAQDGLFFGAGPRAGAQEARSQASMYNALADAGGIPYEQQIQVKMEGGPTPSMPSPSATMVVTSVSTDPIGDDKFQIPSGYTKKNQ